MAYPSYDYDQLKKALEAYKNSTKPNESDGCYQTKTETVAVAREVQSGSKVLQLKYFAIV